MTAPGAVLCELWPLDDMSCCPEWEDLTPEQQLTYQARASEILDHLTGQQFSDCELTVRPCSDHRSMCPLPAQYWSSGPGDMYPYILNGVWHNAYCGGCGTGSGCDCAPPCSARLDPGPIISITEVAIDGVVLPPVDAETGRPNYVVYDWRYLVRTDGHCWPDCQDWNQTPQPPGPGGEPVTCGVWTVTYRFGNPVPIGGIDANSKLACELARAGCGADCALPAGATSVSRDGITIQLDPKDWINNLPEVASWINAVNPNGLITPPVFRSPKRRPRVQTWPMM